MGQCLGVFRLYQGLSLFSHGRGEPFDGHPTYACHWGVLRKAFETRPYRWLYVMRPLYPVSHGFQISYPNSGWIYSPRIGFPCLCKFAACISTVCPWHVNDIPMILHGFVWKWLHNYQAGLISPWFFLWLSHGCWWYPCDYWWYAILWWISPQVFGINTYIVYKSLHRPLYIAILHGFYLIYHIHPLVT